ncbi:MAG: alpha-2-macroglobulin family protein [bacterium]
MAKRASRSRGGGGLPPEPPAGKPVYIRRDFSALAAFEATVMADEHGIAHVDVKVPDSLTRYRLMANVAAEATFFGSGDAALVVRQPLMVRPTKPRFLNVGDRAEFPVVVQNATAKPTQVWLGLRASNLAVTQGGWRVELGANERREVRFPVAAKLAGQVSFQIVGRSDENTDAAEDKFNVMTPATSQTVGTSGSLEDGAVRQDIATPPDAYAAFGGLEVRLSTTLLAGLTDLVVDVYHYPYACAEQRASRLMSIALLKDFLPAFRGDDVPSPAEMLEAAAGDLVALRSLQKSNGGWGFWHEGRAYPTVTIHVVHALVEAKLAGMSVDEAMLAPGLAYLDSIERHVLLLNYSAATRRHLKLHAAWVRSRAGHDETARAKAIWKKDEGKLTVDALGWLLSIFAKASASEAAAVYQELANRITYDGGKMQFVDEPKEVEKHVVLSSNRRSNAIVLDALIDYPARQIDVSRIATALLAHRWKGNSTTQENAFALLGLIRYFREFEKTTPDLNAVVYANDFQVSDHAFQGRQTDIVSQTIPMEWLQGQDPVSVVVSRSGAGRLYWRANMRWAPQDLRLEAEDRGFHVERTFEGVDAESDVTFNDGVWRIKAGAKVRLTTKFVARKPRHHVALVSPIPAGLELLNPAFATTEALDEESTGGFGRDIWAVNGRGGPFFLFDFWWRRWFDHQVLRDDRAEAFAASVWPGVHEHVVFARATMPGEYVVPPARAEEMYEPEVWGRTSSLRVVVE